MAQFAIEIAEADVDRVMDAVAANYNWAENVPNPDFDPVEPVSEQNPETIPNPENKYVFKTRLRKSSKGVATDEDYKMSSIVWRWNHPDNSRNQRDGRGYPNDRLWQDLVVFYFKVQMMKEELQAEDAYWENQTQMILEKQSQVVQSNKQKTFEQLCEYYGIPAFDSSWGYNEWSIKFLGDMKRLIASEKELSEKQQATLIKLIVGNSATEKQVAYLRELGYEGEITTKIQASTLISDLLLSEE